MTICEKLQKIKLELLESGLKKTGHNKFAGFIYYELGDFVPQIIELCDKYKCCTVFNFYESYAVLKIVDSEEPCSEITVESPIEKLEIRGSSAIQALGGVHTYMRRYLFMMMFDIVENDVFDAVSRKTDPEKKYYCAVCAEEFTAQVHNGKTYTPKEIYEDLKIKSPDGKARCKTCRDHKFKKLHEEENEINE